MAFTAEVLKYDPERNVEFRIKRDSKTVAGVSGISALPQSVEAIEWRTGGDPNGGKKLPGQTKYEAITLERGTTAGAGFVRWMNFVSTSLDLQCVGCGEPFRFDHHPVQFLLGQRGSSRGRLLQQVHELARQNRCSLAEILALPRRLRHQLLELIGPEPSVAPS